MSQHHDYFGFAQRLLKKYYCGYLSYSQFQYAQLDSIQNKQDVPVSFNFASKTNVELIGKEPGLNDNTGCFTSVKINALPLLELF